MEYVKSLGGATFLDSWDEKYFSVEKLFEKEPGEAAFIFLKHFVQRCSHPQDKSREIICFISLNDVLFDIGVDDMVKTYKELKIDKKSVRSIYQKSQDFIKSQVRLINLSSLPLRIFLYLFSEKFVGK